MYCFTYYAHTKLWEGVGLLDFKLLQHLRVFCSFSFNFSSTIFLQYNPVALAEQNTAVTEGNLFFMLRQIQTDLLSVITRRYSGAKLYCPQQFLPRQELMTPAVCYLGTGLIPRGLRLHDTIF